MLKTGEAPLRISRSFLNEAPRFWSHEDREGYLDGPHGIIATLKSYLEEEETK